MNGEDPADWPERFEPGTFAKVVTHSEGLWTKIIEDNGETIKATMANNPFGGFAAFGDPVEASAKTSATSSGPRTTRKHQEGPPRSTVRAFFASRSALLLDCEVGDHRFGSELGRHPLLEVAAAERLIRQVIRDIGHEQVGRRQSQSGD
jgi:hypothetical protein